jgi:Fur family transcriptional regulator, iron response regulator
LTAAVPSRTEANRSRLAGPDINARLRANGVRPTRQRMELGRLLFSDCDRHVTAEMLFEEAVQAGVSVSLATVYNTLNQLTEAGLLRQVAVDGSKTYFDTNTAAHHHVFIEGENALIDIPPAGVILSELPGALDGCEVVRIDVVVRLKPRRKQQS